MSDRFPQRCGDDVRVEEVDLDDEVVIVDGERLTNERAQRMAEQFVAHRARGRRSLSGDGSHSPVVQFRVPSALRDAVDERARAEGVPVSVLARRALQAYLDTPVSLFDVDPVAAAIREHVAVVVPPSLMDEVATMLAAGSPSVDVVALRESTQWPRVREAVQVAFRLVHETGESEGSGQDPDGRNERIIRTRPEDTPHETPARATILEGVEDSLRG